MQDVLLVNKVKERARREIGRVPDMHSIAELRFDGRVRPRPAPADKKWAVPFRVAFIMASAAMLWGLIYLLVIAF